MAGYGRIGVYRVNLACRCCRKECGAAGIVQAASDGGIRACILNLFES